MIIGSLISTRDFETRTASGSALFSLITRLRTITFTLQSTFSPLGMIRIKLWETPLSWHAKCSLPVAVRVSKTHLLKLPNTVRKTLTSRIVSNKIYAVTKCPAKSERKPNFFNVWLSVCVVFFSRFG